MAQKSSWYASELRRELGVRNRQWAPGRAYVESYGNPPVIIYHPESGRHGNFFDPAYAAIAAQPEWQHRFDKIHTGQKSLPKAESSRRWRELDSSMSSDALLMNIFCTPGVIESPVLRRTLGSLLVEAKLTEADFQTKTAAVVEGYRDFDAVFDRDLLPRVSLATKRRREPAEFPEDYTQEFEEALPETLRSGFLAQPLQTPATFAADRSTAVVAGYASYQLIRNALAAYSQGSSFCVIHDARRPDLREAWFEVLAAVKSAEMRVRLKVLTWQELVALLPEDLQAFLDCKYGIVAPGKVASPVEIP
jgi:hypothetical protein